MKLKQWQWILIAMVVCGFGATVFLLFDLRSNKSELPEGIVLREIEGEDFFREPFFPRLLEPPTEADLEEWNYVLRYTEFPHTETPYVIEERSKKGVFQLHFLRFVRGELDLFYGISHEFEAEEERSPPEWARSLVKTNDVAGLDGSTVGVELFTSDGVRTIHRWSPQSDSTNRGLDEMISWVDHAKVMLGVRPRINFFEGEFFPPNIRSQ